MVGAQEQTYKPHDKVHNVLDFQVDHRGPTSRVGECLFPCVCNILQNSVFFYLYISKVARDMALPNLQRAYIKDPWYFDPRPFWLGISQWLLWRSSSRVVALEDPSMWYACVHMLGMIVVHGDYFRIHKWFTIFKSMIESPFNYRITFDA